MIIMNSIKKEGLIGTDLSISSHYPISAGFLEIVTPLKGVNYNFSKRNHHMFFEDFENLTVTEIGFPMNFSLVEEEELDFVGERGFIKIDASEKEAI